MASYDPKRSRPATDVDAGPSPIDALLDGDRATPAATPAVVTDDGVVDLRSDAEQPTDQSADHPPDVPTVAPTIPPTVVPSAPTLPPSASTVAVTSEPSDPRRSPIVPVPGPDHRSRRLVTTLIAVASGLGILVIARAIRRSRRS